MQRIQPRLLFIAAFVAFAAALITIGAGSLAATALLFLAFEILVIFGLILLTTPVNNQASTLQSESLDTSTQAVLPPQTAVDDASGE
ncbi:MAG: hypothetical protein NVS4B8_23770 [Herpetosiphon sp.]